MWDLNPRYRAPQLYNIIILDDIITLDYFSNLDINYKILLSLTIINFLVDFFFSKLKLIKTLLKIDYVTNKVD